MQVGESSNQKSNEAEEDVAAVPTDTESVTPSPRLHQDQDSIPAENTYSN